MPMLAIGCFGQLYNAPAGPQPACRARPAALCVNGDNEIRRQRHELDPSDGKISKIVESFVRQKHEITAPGNMCNPALGDSRLRSAGCEAGEADQVRNDSEPG